MAHDSCDICHTLSEWCIFCQKWFVNPYKTVFLDTFFGIIWIIFIWTNSPFLLPLQSGQVGTFLCAQSSGNCMAWPHFWALTHAPTPFSFSQLCILGMYIYGLCLPSSMLNVYYRLLFLLGSLSLLFTKTWF